MKLDKKWSADHDCPEASVKECHHGLWKTPEYRVWSNMLSRCGNSNYVGYYSCGGRGVKVCDRWRNFLNFYEDMGKRPGSGREYHLKRIDDKKGYEPGNCVWMKVK